jgi:hypothetical protein
MKAALLLSISLLLMGKDPPMARAESTVKKIEITDGWKFSQAGSDTWYDARVPGLDLPDGFQSAAGASPDEKHQPGFRRP